MADVVKAAVSTPTPTPLALPVEITLYRPRELTVVLVGAGGTGARIAPDVARLLSRGDRLFVVDPDVVEERNLARQHFVREDVGQFKAAIVARRAQMAAPPGVQVEAKVTRIASPVTFLDTAGISDGLRSGVLWIGAVDTRQTRLDAMDFLLRGHIGLWVDAGNELRGGQVGLIGNWPLDTLTRTNNPRVAPFSLREWFRREYEGENEEGEERSPRQVTWEYANNGIILSMFPLVEVLPEIFKPDPEAEGLTAGCAIRLDTQSLAANVMAYAGVISIVSRILDGLPLTSGVSFFSTSGVMSAKTFQFVEEVYGKRFLASVTSTTAKETLRAAWARLCWRGLGAPTDGNYPRWLQTGRSRF